MPWSDAHDELFKKINREMDEYAQQMQSMSGTQVYAHAEEISATRLCYNQLLENFHSYPAEYMEYLLRFEQPLSVVRDRWLSVQSDAPGEAFEHMFWELCNKQDTEMDCSLDSDWQSGPSMY